jgi:Ohr subfamily peroxiredoxin
MTPLYTASATTTGGRSGRSRSSDGVLDLQLSMPKEIGGAGGTGTNPEQLFAAGYSACFQSALQLVARQQKIDTSKSLVTAKVTLNKTPQNAFQLSAILNVAIPGVPRDVAEKLVAAAHQVCPYSLATRGNMPVELVVEQTA